MTEQSTIRSGIVMIDKCPGCGNTVGGGNKVARDKPENSWWHQRCWDKRTPYNWKEQGAFDPEPDDNQPDLWHEEGSY